MTYNEFVTNFYGIYYTGENKNLREGQALMNYLRDVRKDLYDTILGTDKDCFYRSHLIKSTLDFLKENL